MSRFGKINHIDICLVLNAPRSDQTTIVSVLQKDDIVTITDDCINKKSNEFVSIIHGDIQGYIKRKFIDFI